MEKKTIRELKRGEFFTLKPVEYPRENQVYIRGDFCRSDRRFECVKWSDVNFCRFFSGRSAVYTGFTF